MYVMPLGEAPSPLTQVAKMAIGLLLLAGACYVVAIRKRIPGWVRP